VGNFLVFRALKISIATELDELSRNKLLQWTIKKVKKYIPSFARIYILPAFAGFIAATPLPDELAVALLSWSKNMSLLTFSTVAFTFNAFGIFIIIWIGRII
jgi:glycine/D-amino acid oxidase-like deaminating enzyme